MTTIDLYRKHKAGEVSREKFLYEVRRDNNLPFITNLTSYDDAVKILKNKGIVTEVDTKEAKADEAVKAEVKPKAQTKKAPKELHIDQANPYEYRHGLQHELGANSDYSDESLAKAKAKVLKNLAKDANYYSTLLNQDQSHYKFKEPEVYAKGMQANADGTLKKGAGKLEKTNVKDNLGKKEAGKVKPKGIKIMPDKGVTGAQKTIKEGAEAENKINQYISVETDEDGDEYPQLNSQAISDYLKSILDPEEVDSFMNDEEGFDESSMHFDIEDNTTEKEVEDWAKQEMNHYLYSDSDEFIDEDLKEGKNEEEEDDDDISIPSFLKTYNSYAYVDALKAAGDIEDDGYEGDMEDDEKDYDADYSEPSEPFEMAEEELSMARHFNEAKAKKYVVFDKARGEKASKVFDTKEEAEAELKKINTEDPEHGDYVIDVMEGVQPKEDKHAKIKEALKSALKKEGIYRNSKGEAVIATSTQSDAELRKRGYTLVPGTVDATGVKK
jgi:hypothetical protein